MQNFRTFFLQHYGTLGTSVLTLLLLLLEKSIESEFICPSNRGLSIGYSLTFLLGPALVLGILGYKLSGKVWCRCVLKTLYGPLLWIFILLSDGRYVSCFGELDTRQIFQIVGVILISLLLILTFTLEELCCCRCISALYFRQKYEEKILKELEEGLRAKAKRKQTEIAEDFVEIVTNKSFTPKQANWLETLENLVYNEKQKIRNKFKEDIIITAEEHRRAAALRATSHGQMGGSDGRRPSV